MSTTENDKKRKSDSEDFLDSTKRQKDAPKRIFLNAFDMFTVGHLSFGQWRNPKDASATKRRDLSYWTNLAKLLEEGDINALFLADTFGQHDVYKGSAEACMRSGAQYPMGDPAIPVTAMASVTKNLGFAITTSTSYEAPYTVGKEILNPGSPNPRQIWMEHCYVLEKVGVQSSMVSGYRMLIHDQRYEIADEFVRSLYKLWEGSWADDALAEDAENEIYSDFNRIRTIHHHGNKFKFDAPHILDPSPQRTPFLFQAGTSPAGIAFGAAHAEGVFVSALSPHILAPRVKAIRAKAAEFGRDPKSVKIFAIMTPIIGRTTEEAKQKYQDALKYASTEGGLSFFSGNSGIDLSKHDLDTEISPSDSTIDAKVHSLVASLNYKGDDVPVWTPRNIGKIISIGGNGPVPVGSPEEVADVLEEWIDVADLDGFNIGYVLTPGSFEDLVHLLIPELRKRGRYAPLGESGTMRERIYGKGQSKLRDDHPGSRYKYDNYEAEPTNGQ